ncbi:leader peptidase (prepilin peptidase)/N-methyltransferase [Arthrobacter sp. V4I6]|uniref:prepilin peptidase n=1 Tax=unclassified Arthrobacter TaxID=235627 RepID=UPI00278B4EDB|nr:MULTISPECIES: A24 family peptidase [unclassified Arthrobacter]MDQ0820010.1 leader peptidase (prepilin peptidase)/N-methyltransferase [Arthrobacter sp. V1I7]MDQ0854191.1 leader peptidase (prepilin peptidase)/N-methyltransferase [Arthrobacter sp. V4I6]
MSDPAATGSALPFFMTAIGALGLLLGLLAELLIRRLLPHLAATPSTIARITTAAVTFGLSALLAWRFGAAAELPAYLLLAIAGVQLARIDVLHHLLPNRLVLPLLGAGLLLLTLAAGAAGEAENLVRGVGGAVILFAGYLILALASRNGLGMGDVKLAAPLGLYLGYQGWSQLFYGGALGFVAGGLVFPRPYAEKPRKQATGSRSRPVHALRRPDGHPLDALTPSGLQCRPGNLQLQCRICAGNAQKECSLGRLSTGCTHVQY